jgi:SAM-dependent methyltransferase
VPAQAPFDAFYYANCCGRPYQRDDEWLVAFGRIADRIVADFAPRRVMDAGCALGLLVETLRTRGVEAWGVDISRWAIERVHDSVAAFCREGSIAQPLGERYDLIVCMEVVEHMPAVDAEAAIANFCTHADHVLFSSTPHDHREPTHVNVHPPEHWAELFARHGFFRDVDYDAAYITPWAAHFQRRTEPVHRLVRGYERRFAELTSAAGQARDYATELQGRVDHLERELAEVRRTLTRELEHARALLRPAQAGAAEAEAMKRSPFWRIRNLAVKLIGR